MKQSPSCEYVITSAILEFHETFYWTRRINIVLITALYRSLSWPPLLHTISLTYNLILSSCLRLGFSFSFLLALHQHSICILLDFITIVPLGEEHTLWSSSLCSFLNLLSYQGKQQRSWLRHCAASRRITGSGPDEMKGFFFQCSYSFQPLMKMSIGRRKNISGE
jgi:hypothetical protein